MAIEIPLGLRHALESGECVLFLGAGVGKHLQDSSGKPLPNGPELADELAKHFSIDSHGSRDLAKISEVVEIRKGRLDLNSFLQKRLGATEPDESFQWLFSLRWNAIFTTNYDNGIERAYAKISKPPQNPVTISSTAGLVSFNALYEVPVYHLHGTLFGANLPQIVITRSDYAHYSEKRRMLFEILKKDFATSTILYLGYSNQDTNWSTLLDEMAAEFYPSKMPQAYRVAPSTDVLENEILRSKGIETIDATLDDFIQSATVALGSIKIDPERLQKAKSAVPHDLLPAFDKNPAAVTRLLSSWVYVNQAPFNEPPNLKNFLRGDRANWALVGRADQFERDIEEDVMDELLDYATGSQSGPTVSAILGPAGFGVSTVLMSFCAKLVKEKAGPVFMHRIGTELREGDIDFASALFPQAPFFAVDNCTDSPTSLSNAIANFREKKRPAYFLLGERLNEWRQGHARLNGKEFQIEALSDDEINRLLDCLARHGELNALEPLPRDLQFSAIQKKHGKMLLVAMREATEGKSFDAIIENEFRDIPDALSRQVYLIVCCFYQHGAYLRDSLLSDLVNKPLIDLYNAIGKPTEGVVIFECTDAVSGTYTARARHRTIAEIVWNRCGDPGGKEELLQAALKALNLNYPADKIAFECFFRSDAIVDGIRTLDGKTVFFETACKKDPNSPYVRQHYARMLGREKKADLALGQIDQAIGLNPKARILYHTKGLVLQEIALESESPEIARRRVVQSEDSFRRGLGIDSRDEYCHQGIARLYLEWAKKCPTPGESADYIAKAEGAINDGLKQVRTREGLWIVSAEIANWVGASDAHLAALEKAVAESPAGHTLARYLLGRAYRKGEQYDKAIVVLKPIILEHHDMFRAFVEYALSLVGLDHPYAEAIATLNLAQLPPSSDARYIATLGGLLFLNKQFTEGEKLFGQMATKGFSPKESYAVQFRFRNSHGPLTFTGTVAAMKPRYCLIDVPGYPRILHRSSRLGNIALRQGLKIDFQPAFTCRGAVTENAVLKS